MASVSDDVKANAGPDITRPRASGREDLLTMVFVTWLIVGIFMDAWAHSHSKPEASITPWHALR